MKKKILKWYKWITRYDKRYEMNQAEAIYAFCGWLTTRSKRTIMSAKHDSSKITPLIEEFIKVQNLKKPAKDWAFKIKKMKK